MQSGEVMVNGGFFDKHGPVSCQVSCVKYHEYRSGLDEGSHSFLMPPPDALLNQTSSSKDRGGRSFGWSFSERSPRWQRVY